MIINEIIMWLLSIFLVIGAVDYCIGNKLGLGKAFHEGVMNMGSLALSMIGIITLAPILASLLLPLIEPVYAFIGADPSSFANSILAADMGGYFLAQQMAISEESALFSWVFIGTMLGPTIVFILPVALTMIRKEDQLPFAKGILIGISTIPIGCLVGGAAAGFDFRMMLINLLLPIVFSLLIIVGLVWKPDNMILIFILFGKFIRILGIIGFAIAAFQLLTGTAIIPGISPYADGLKIVGTITVVLGGAFPFIAFFKKTCRGSLEKFGRILKLDQVTVTAMVSSLAHVIPAFLLLTDMSNRGKVVCMAFCVSGSFVVGGHLGFVSMMNEEMSGFMILGKLAGGLTAAAIAMLVQKNEFGLEGEM